MTREEYISIVRKTFKECEPNASEEEIDEYFSEEESQEVINEGFRDYGKTIHCEKDGKKWSFVAGQSPYAVASCLSMMY